MTSYSQMWGTLFLFFDISVILILSRNSFDFSGIFLSFIISPSLPPWLSCFAWPWMWCSWGPNLDILLFHSIHALLWQSALALKSVTCLSFRFMFSGKISLLSSIGLFNQLAPCQPYWCFKHNMSKTELLIQIVWLWNSLSGWKATMLILRIS